MSYYIDWNNQTWWRWWWWWRWYHNNYWMGLSMMWLLCPSSRPLFRTLTCFFLHTSLKKTLEVDNTHWTIQFLRILAFLPFSFYKKFNYFVFRLLWSLVLVHIARPKSLVSNQIYQKIPPINQIKFKFSLILLVIVDTTAATVLYIVGQ